MADIAASDVTYALVSRDIDGGKGKRVNVCDVTFGNGALTYPSGGVPLTKAQLGAPNSLEQLVMVEPEAGNGLVYKYDASSEKMRVYEGDYAQAGDAALTELDAGADAPAAATLRVVAIGW